MVIRYVVLSYVHELTTSKGQDIITVICPLEPLQEDRLLLYVRPEWIQYVETDDLEYIMEVIDDLRQKSTDEMVGIFDLLCHMSSGCLRAARQGTCEDDNLEKVVDGQIGRASCRERVYGRV